MIRNEAILENDLHHIGITLTCSEETLRARHKKRGDNGEVSFYWLHLPPYPGDIVIDTDDKTIQNIVGEINTIIKGVKP